MATAELKKGDVKDIGLADAGKRKIEWAQQQMPVLRTHPQAFHQGTAAEGIACFRLSARDQRNRQPDDRAARRWRGHRALRFESALHAGRSGGVAESRLQHSDVRDQRRGQRHLLPALEGGSRTQAAIHDGRWLRPRDYAAHQAPGPGCQRHCGNRRNHHRRHSSARHGQGRHVEVSDHRRQRRA